MVLSVSKFKLFIATRDWKIACGTEEKKMGEKVPVKTYTLKNDYAGSSWNRMILLKCARFLWCGCLFSSFLSLHTLACHMHMAFNFHFGCFQSFKYRIPLNELFAKMYSKTRVQSENHPKSPAPLKLISSGKFHKDSPNARTLQSVEFVWLCFLFNLHFFPFAISSHLHIDSRWCFYQLHLNWWCANTQIEKKSTGIDGFSLVVLEFYGIQLTWSAMMEKTDEKNSNPIQTIRVHFMCVSNLNKMCLNIALTIWANGTRSTCTGNGKKTLIIWHAEKEERESGKKKKTSRITEKRAVKLPAFKHRI